MVKAIDLISDNGLLQEHWFKRFVAAIIDGAVIIVISWILFTFLILAFYIIPFATLILSFFSGFLWFIYSFVMEGFSGSTIGKRVLNLRVVSFEGPMSMSKSIVRNFSKIHPLLFFLDWLIGFVMEGDPRQRYFDRIANTTVVRTDAQEVFAGAFQPPKGPMPQPYGPQGPGPVQTQDSKPKEPAPQEAQPPAHPEPAPAAEPAPTADSDDEPETKTADDGEKYTRQELVNMRKEDLTKIAQKMGLKVSGTKRDLIDRILGEEIQGGDA